jgi:hypothetical protein
MLQAIYTLSVMYPHQYWSGVIVLLILVCAGWYRLGVTRLVVAGAPTRQRVVVQWRLHPFAHSVLVQVASVTIMGRLESDVDYLAASVAVRISYRY